MPRATHPRPSYGRRSPWQGRPRPLACEMLESRLLLSGLAEWLNPPASFPAPSDLNQPGSTQATAADTQERRDLTYLAQSLPTAELPVFDQVDTPLLLLYSRYLQGSTVSVGQQTIYGTPYGDVFSTDGTRPHVQAFVQSAVVARSAFAGLGMEVTAVTDTPSWQVVAGYLPVDAIDDAAHVAGMGVLQASERGHPAFQGSVANQWETVSYADQLKRVLTSVDGNEANMDGRIEIGVISDSINQVGGGVAASQATGDLPPGNRVQILDDGPGGGTDEGRAMAELVYDIGPQFNLLFHSGFNSAADMAGAFDELRQSGADIITDDIVYFSEPIFQDGQINGAKDRVYLDHGVLVFGAAGNYNNESYYDAWQDPDGDDFHNFAGGDETLNVTLGPGELLNIYLQWEEPWGDASTDIDIELYNSDLSRKLADSDIDNNPVFSSGNPFEFLTYTNNGAANASYHVAFFFDDGDSPEGLTLSMLAPNNSDDFSEAYVLNEPAIAGNETAAWQFTMGAVPYLNTAATEPFSSQGPSTIFFSDGGQRLAEPEIREKPDFLAADKVDNTFFGGGDAENPPNGFPNFSGTSAASPNAAAVAGLVLDAANRSLSYTELSQIFAQTAIGTGAGDWDPAFGEGLINALGAGLVARGLLSNEVFLELNPFGDVAASEHELASDSDIDRFAFAVDRDGQASITVTDADAQLDPGLILWNTSSGNFQEIDYNDAGGGGAVIDRSLADGRLYQAEVFTEATIGGPGANKPFTIQIDARAPFVTPIGLDAVGDGAAAANLMNNDADYFSIVAPETAGDDLTVTLRPGAALDGVLTLYDEDGQQLRRSNSTGAGGEEIVTFGGVGAGLTYYLRVGSRQYATTGAYDVEVNFETSLPLEMTDAEGFAYFHNDGTSHDTQTFSAFEGDAEIDYGNDIDSFFFSGQSEGMYAVSVNVVSGNVRPVAGVYDAATGSKLDYSGFSRNGNDIRMTFALAARHRYIVAVADERHEGTGDLEIVIEGPELLSATPIAVNADGAGSSLDNELNVVEDSDFFRFTAPADADGTLTLTVSPFWIGLDTAAILFDAAGNELAKSYLPGGGENDVIAFGGVVPSTTYYLTVLSKDYADQGRYDVSLEFGIVRGSIRGTKFYDLDQDGVFDGGEPGLKDWIVYADLDDDALFDPAGRIEPDDYADGTLVNDVLPTVHLRAAGRSVINRLIPVVSGRPASTGWKVFGNGWSDRAEWAELDASFVADFLLPVSRVSLDFIADDAADTGVLVAYGRQNQVIAQVGTGAMNAGEAKTLSVQVPGNEIHWVSATGGAGHPVQLDNFRFGPGPGEPFAFTDAGGRYAMEDLPLGTYPLREVLQDSWQQTAPAGGEQVVTLTLQAPDATGADFGNYSAPQIHGIVWEDLNGDGVRDAGEPGLAGWTIFDDWGDGEPNPEAAATLTNASGEYWFAGLDSGSHEIAEVLPPNWAQTWPEGWPSHFVDVGGQLIDGIDFGNYQYSTASGFVFNDLDADGLRDQGEPGLDGWLMFVDVDGDGTRTVGDPWDTVHAGGFFSIMNIPPGDYRLRHTPQAGWVPVVPADDYYEIVVTSGSTLGYFNFAERERLDFGDAPAPYPTRLADNGPRHRLVPYPRLAIQRDEEPDGQPNFTAEGDDLAGTDDEDGITFLTALSPGQAAQVRVDMNGYGTLDAWLDFNADGDWDDAGERIFAGVFLEGPMTLGFAVPGWSVPGPTYARFRVTNNGVASYTGPADSGEVEDYRVEIQNPFNLPLVVPPLEDDGPVNQFGDRNVTFTLDTPSDRATWRFTTKAGGPATFSASGNASSGLHPLLALYNGKGDLVAVGSGGSDPSQNTLSYVLTPGTHEVYTLLVQDAELDTAGVVQSFFDTPTVSAIDTLALDAAGLGGIGATLIAHTIPPLADVDYYRLVAIGGGTPDPADRLAVKVTPVQSYRLEFQLFDGLGNPVGDRVLSPVNGQPAERVYTGLPGGRSYVVAVFPYRFEDHPAGGDYRIDVDIDTFDFGDAPASYATLVADNGPSHLIVSGLYLGSRVDNEWDGQPGAAADGDGGDEDGVVFIDAMSPGHPTDIQVTASAAGMLDAWVDFNADGGFDLGEQVFASAPLVAGPNDLTIRVPIGAALGQTYARFRFSSTGGLLPGGAAADGEVEDYRVGIESSGEIHGTVWHDSDTDGTRGTSEPGLAGWTVFLDEDDDLTLDTNEPYAVTDSGGNYAFLDVPPGNYNVAQLAPPGWNGTLPVFVPEWVYVVGSAQYLTNWVTILDFDLNLVDQHNPVQLGEGVATDIEIGPGGDVYVAVDGRGESEDRIVQFTYEMEFVRTIDLVNRELYPRGFDVLPDGSLLMARPDDHEIVQLDSDGRLAVETFDLPLFAPVDAGMTSDGFIAFSEDALLNVRPDDLIWVASWDGTVLQDIAGTVFVERAGSHEALEINDGSLFMLDIANHVLKLDAAGQELADYDAGLSPFGLSVATSALAVGRHEVPYGGGPVRGWAALQGSVAVGPVGNRLATGLTVTGASEIPVPPPANPAQMTGRGTWSVVVQPGQIVQGVDFGNVQESAASGVKFNDLDGDGVHDTVEPGLDGWVVWADLDDDGVRDGREPSATTSGGGLFTIQGILPGTYKIREEIRAGWTQTAPAAGYHEVQFTSGSAVTGLEFGNRQAFRVYVVNSTADPDDAGPNSAELTLREAIVAANTFLNRLEPDRIVFDIPAGDPGHVYYRNDGIAGQVSPAQIAATTADDDSLLSDADPDWPHSWFSIRPTSDLPWLSDPVVVDGYSQSGSRVNTNFVDSMRGLNSVLKVELDDRWATGNALLLDSPAGGSTVRGLVINRSRGSGIVLSKGNGHVIEGNYIGTDPSGTLDLGNAAGLYVGWSGSSGNLIGGRTPPARNLISGNSGDGMRAITTGNRVQGNLIGTDRAGTRAIRNDSDAVDLAANANLVGGTERGSRNILSGNGFTGVFITGSNNLVQGNFIGTDVTGKVALGNVTHGVRLVSTGNVIGGTDGDDGTVDGFVAARNVISANLQGGISVESATGTRIQGNFIGTDVTGTANLGNGFDTSGGRYGGVIVYLAANTLIGGTEPGAGNRIAFNAGEGVLIRSTTGHAILSNAIFANGRLGIDLGLNAVGVTPNDPGDADTGANNLQNFPVLTSAIATASNTNIQGSLNSTPSTAFRVELFANEAADESGFGEGQTYLGSIDVTTNSAGDAIFEATVPTALPAGRQVTATATVLLSGGGFGDSSEYSQAAPVTSTTAEIRGRFFHDINNDGTPGTGEPGLAGWTAFLDLDDDLTLDTNEPYVVTDAGGNYAFTGLQPGSYNVAQVLRPNWLQTMPVVVPEWIYVAVRDPQLPFEVRRNVVRVYDFDGNPVDTIWHDEFELGHLTDVEIGPGGDVYVGLDTLPIGDGQGEIVQFTYDGQFVRVIDLPEDPDASDWVGWYPYGFDVLSDGSLLVAQPDGQQIVLLDRDGVLVDTFPTQGDNLLDAPQDVGVLSTGEIVYTLRIAPSPFGVPMLNVRRDDLYWTGYFTTLFDGGEAVRDFGMYTIDPLEAADGSLYATTNDEWGLRKWDAQGNVVWEATTLGDPQGLAVARNEGQYHRGAPPPPFLRAFGAAPAAGFAEAIPTGRGNWNVVLGAGEVALGADFGNVELSTASGQVFADRNGNGIPDADDFGLDGWLVWADLDDDNVADGREPSATTANGGQYTIARIPPGSYKIREDSPRDWDPTIPAAGYREIGFPPGSAVEDVNFGNRPGWSDFGDAPAPYATLWADDGAWHAIDSNLRLGDQIDGEPDGQPHGTAEGDDLAEGDDEDGVTVDTLLTGISASARVVFSSPGLLSAWVDWNQDGDWADPGEQVLADQPLAGNFQFVDFDVPETALVGPTFARFRLSTQAGLSFDGPAPDGEVEDYQVLVQRPVEIHGRKWNDLDADGTWDEGELPLVGWTIFLDENGDRRLNDGVPPEPSTITDENGAYSFTGLAPGTYTVAELDQDNWEPTFPLGNIRRVSVDAAGNQGDGNSSAPAVSGLDVIFQSIATNLVPPFGPESVIYEFDWRGHIHAQSINSDGDRIWDDVFDPSVYGLSVAAESRSWRIVPGDNNGVQDIFVFERVGWQGTPNVERVSVVGWNNGFNEEPNGDSSNPSIGGASELGGGSRGRFVAFQSDATNLLGRDELGFAFDRNGVTDVFVFDREHNILNLITATFGFQGDLPSFDPAISHDGWSLAFTSLASNLVPDDTNGQFDIFVTDPYGNEFERVSVGRQGDRDIEANGPSDSASLSDDGRFVAFLSAATNLVSGDINGAVDIFVFDRQTRTIERVSVGRQGDSEIEADGPSFAPSISRDGRFVAFESQATNLVPGDTNGESDIFLFDRQKRTIERVSVDGAGNQADRDSHDPSISYGGRVAFASFATNLVPGDTNNASDVFLYEKYVHTVTLTSGQVAEALDFGNVYYPNSVTGVTYHDLNRSGARDPDEPGLDRWVVYVDLNDNGAHEATEPFDITHDGGQFDILANVPPGRYKVREVPQSGWISTEPAAGFYEFAFAPEARYGEVLFGNRQALDYGDAPDPSYPTLIVSNGASHLVRPGFHLGNLVDDESDGQPPPASDGADEDGVHFRDPLVRGQQARIDVFASAPGALDAWIDFNVDGDWSDPGERIFTAEPLVFGVNPLSILVPSLAVDGFSAARFRFSADGVPSFDGPGPAGEVEDYVVRLYEQNPNFVVNVPAARADNRLVLRRSGDRAQLVDSRNNRLLFNQPLSAIESLTILGAANRSDLLTVDVGYGGSFVIPSGILFDGGAGSRPDRLAMRGTPGADEYVIRQDQVGVNGILIGLRSLEQVSLEGRAGNDSYQVSDLSAKTTLVDRRGIDTLDFSGAAAGVTIDLGKILGQPQRIFAANAYRLALKGTVENVTGSPQADRIAGNSAANAMRGGDGSDTLIGRAGNDILYGEAGDDWLYGDAGNDILYGGRGNNVLLGGAGSDILDVNADVTAGAGRNLLIGGLGVDTFQGGPGEEILIGGATKYDSRKAALDLIMKEWTSGNAWEDRCRNLETGITDPANPKLGTVQLKRKNTANRNGSVLDDRARDSLLGSLGSDWFFNFGSDEVRDRGSEDR